MADQQPAKNSQSRRSTQTATSKPVVAKKKVDPKPPQKVIKKAKRPRATPRKHEPLKMFEWYCEDMTRTYADIAKHFKVRPDYVRKMAAKDDTTWMERRMKVAEKLERKITKRRYREAQERDDVHLKSFRSAIIANTNTIITEGNKQGDKDVKAITTSTMALYRAVMGERIILGLPVLIARSEILTDEEDVPTLRDAQLSAERMAERAKELEDMRNNG